MRCWGSNSNGQLGNGTTGGANVLSPPSADLVLPGGSVSSVAAFNCFTCVLYTSGGGVACWGANEHGQLGLGTVVDTNSAPASPVITGVIQMSLGYWHMCVRMATSNGIRCWGDASNGCIGTGNETVNLLSPPSQDLIIPTNDILAQLECGIFSTCILNVTGGVKYAFECLWYPFTHCCL